MRTMEMNDSLTLFFRLTFVSSSSIYGLEEGGDKQQVTIHVVRQSIQYRRTVLCLIIVPSKRFRSFLFDARTP